MANRYPQYVEPINLTENVGDSLIKINNNFENLKRGYCDLKQQIDDIVQIRTFFYFGPNAQADSTSGMQNYTTSRPSNFTIQTFVNDGSQLNLPSMSDPGDIAFVVYQKTGYLSQQAVRTTSGYVPVLGTSAAGAGVSTSNDPIYNPPLLKYAAWSTTTPDRYNLFSPAYVIWRLTAGQNKTYTVDSGWPKFTQAETLTTPNWNQPWKWAKY
jgi:hypothetical protein